MANPFLPERAPKVYVQRNSILQGLLGLGMGSPIPLGGLGGAVGGFLSAQGEMGRQMGQLQWESAQGRAEAMAMWLTAAQQQPAPLPRVDGVSYSGELHLIGPWEVVNCQYCPNPEAGPQPARCSVCGYIEGHGPRHWAGCSTQGGTLVGPPKWERPRAVYQVESVKEREARFLREAMAELDLVAPEGTIEPPERLTRWERFLVWLVRTFRLWSFASV